MIVNNGSQEVIGAGHVGRYGQKGEIADVIIAPPHRGQGLGTALVQALMQIAAEQNWLPLEIGVMANNRRALRLYKRLGFHQVH